jgi:NAD(P)-dependent dehydrogenase (short-subunit alcohol dehydrogenase family)
MDLQLGGKVVLVTGAGQGLGRSIGSAFAREGAHVAFHYHSSAGGADAAAAEARALGVKALAVGADLRSDGAVAAAVQQVERQLGPIDVSSTTRRDPAALSRDYARVGVLGGRDRHRTLRITQAARGMSARGAGAIVNLMGDSGRVGESGLLVTGTTRASTVGLTRSLAKELARYGIRANCVSLALVQTDSLEAHASGADDARMKKILAQYPLRRVGRPDDVTPMILLLASPRSGWTTGQVVSVNGGYAMV